MKSGIYSIGEKGMVVEDGKEGLVSCRGVIGLGRTMT
jgi:hypothetical protein